MQILKTGCAVVLCLAAHYAWPQPVSASSAALAPPAIELKFRDFFASPVGPLGLAPSAALRAAHGQRVRLVGYMVAQEEPPVGRFLFAPFPLQMSEHADGDADDLPPSTVTVILPPADSAMPLSHTRSLMQLTGVLDVGRAEALDGRVSWVRLLLDAPPATARQPQKPSAKPLGHTHD